MSGNSWPEQEAVVRWQERNGIDIDPGTRIELCEEVSAERIRLQERLARIEADREHLLAYAAAMGRAMRPDADPDTANEAWRALPPHLQDEIEQREEGSDE